MGLMSQNAPSGSLALMIFGALWSVGVAATDFKYADYVIRQQRTAGFSRTDGEITASHVTTRRSDGNDVHGVVLAYTYVVDGRTFQGSRYSTSESEESGSWAAEVVREYPTGARVPIFYAPDDPSQAVLRPGLSAAWAVPALFI